MSYPTLEIIDCTNSDFLECLKCDEEICTEEVLLDSIVQIYNDILKREFIIFLGFITSNDEFQRHQNTYPAFYGSDSNYESLKIKFQERTIVKILHSHYPKFVEHWISLQQWTVVGKFN